MIEVPVAHLLDEAEFRASQLPVYEMSIRGDAANQVGCLGELVGMEHLRRCGVEFEEVFVREYDVLFNNRHTLEFKTKERTVVPQPHYDCSAPFYNHELQRPDYYLFISLLSTNSRSSDISRFTKAYILGSIDRETFDRKALLWTKDQIDTSNGWKPTKDVYNVLVSDLQPPMVRHLGVEPSVP